MKGVLRAKREAQRVLAEARPELQRLPVPVDKIAQVYAQVDKMALPDGISGMLVPVGDGWVIAVNRNDHPLRQRFTIAHELGHLRLHGYTVPHADRDYKLRDARSSDGSVLEEIEANRFAAELLMPEEYVLAAISKEGLDYDPHLDSREAEIKVSRIAGRFKVSKQAMLIRISSLLA